MSGIDRRCLLLAAGAALLPLGGCTTGGDTPRPGSPRQTAQSAATGTPLPVDYGKPLYDEPYFVPGIEPGSLPEIYRRHRVTYDGREAPGTIIVQTGTHFLYLVEPGGQALRYGIGLGREGFGWKGRAVIGARRAWPSWHPPGEMIGRDPRLRIFAGESGGMAAGTDNPLGARALYLYQNGRDTLYRIHGTNDPGSIGQAVTSGCVRMMNVDVIDLYRRVGVGAAVIVL